MTTIEKRNIQLQLGIKPTIGNIEIIERKGWGHPDKLADDLAEELSRAYARHTLSECGVVLHHNFDKLCILGGSAKVLYGSYKIGDSIRILVNGRATTRFAGRNLNIEDLIYRCCKKFFEDRLPILNSEKGQSNLYLLVKSFFKNFL